jgi:thiol-disulfide isomerase/thioredoxin
MGHREFLGLLALAAFGVFAGSHARSVGDDPSEVVTDAADFYAHGVSSVELILVLRSDCGACRAIKPQWDALVESLPTTVGVRAVVSDSDTGSGIKFADGRIQFQRVAPSVLRTIGVTVVPTTIVLDADGTAIFFEEGYLGEERLASLRELLVAAR